MLNKLALALVIGSVTAGAFSQTISDIQVKTSGSAYLQDSRGVIVRTPFGLCWRTGYWTPADAVAGCDGELAPPVAKITAPAMATAPAATTTLPVVSARCDFNMSMTSDQTFAFNKAVLTKVAKNRIDNELLGKLATCARIDVVMVTGHTDSLGSRQYNQKLSEKRASAVAAYLKAKGIAARISTLGVGDTQPVKSCDQKLSRRKLINCLTPNRRVTVEVHSVAK